MWRNLTKAQRKALEYILFYAQSTGRQCFTYNDLARYFRDVDVKINIETLNRRIRELVDNGLLRRQETTMYGRKRVRFCLRSDIYEDIYDNSILVVEGKIKRSLNREKLKIAHWMVDEVRRWSRAANVRLNAVHYGGSWLYDLGRDLYIIVSVSLDDYDESKIVLEKIRKYALDVIVSEAEDRFIEAPRMHVILVPGSLHKGM